MVLMSKLEWALLGDRECDRVRVCDLVCECGS